MKSFILACLILLPMTSFAKSLQCEAGKYKIELTESGSNQIEFKFYDGNGKLAIKSKISSVEESGNTTIFAHHPTNFTMEIENLQSTSKTLKGIFDMNDPDAGQKNSRMEMFCIRK
ncbi:hypothetical protein [Bdellovibrio sp.]|uniref:hypothetical protein n=1 Tax=Bdellovibrio TaxID=958 RepID=UPI003221B78E